MKTFTLTMANLGIFFSCVHHWHVIEIDYMCIVLHTVFNVAIGLTYWPYIPFSEGRLLKFKLAVFFFVCRLKLWVNQPLHVDLFHVLKLKFRSLKFELCVHIFTHITFADILVSFNGTRMWNNEQFCLSCFCFNTTCIIYLMVSKQVIV